MVIMTGSNVRTAFVRVSRSPLIAARSPRPVGASLGPRTFGTSLLRSSNEGDHPKKSFEHLGQRSIHNAAKPSSPPTPPGGGDRRFLKSFSMENKVCVVTGGARGLGNTFARAFVESGCNSIAIIDLRQEDTDKAAKELTDYFESEGLAAPGEIQAVGYGCDISNESSVIGTFQEIVDRWGKIDTVVTAAGIAEHFPAFDYPTNRMAKLYNINVHGTFFCAREAAKHMVAKGTNGSVVLIASMSAGIVNYPQRQMPYNASKAAVKHMAASLAVEWAPHGIRVNSLSPGYMLTAMTKTLLDKEDELKKTWTSLTPMGRMGDPEELKGAIVYLASDASKFTTGTELTVDGGYTIV